MTFYHLILVDGDARVIAALCCVYCAWLDLGLNTLPPLLRLSVAYRCLGECRRRRTGIRGRTSYLSAAVDFEEWPTRLLEILAPPHRVCFSSEFCTQT